MVKVSIGMPVFNGGQSISKALDSLLAQSFLDFELIISDNASDDDTERICKAYSKKDHRVAYSRRQSNVGALENFRQVLSLAQGKYFFWAPHDDYWDTRFIELAVTTLDANPNASACMGVVRYISQDGREFAIDSPPYNLNGITAADRACSYFRQGLTDNLIYAVHRRNVVQDAPFESSACPEKLIILHTILRGQVVEAPEMEYSNVVSLKTSEQVAAAFILDGDYAKEESKVFKGVSGLLYLEIDFLSFCKIFPLFFFKNNWHKFYAKRFLSWLCIS